MHGWRDGGRTRLWQWPARLVTAAWMHVRTAAALEDLDKRSTDVPLVLRAEDRIP